MNDSRRLIFLIYPGFQLLDLSGPMAVFAGANRALGRTVYELVVAAEAPGPISSSSGLDVIAGAGFNEIRESLAPRDSLIAIGGEIAEIDRAISDSAIIDLLASEAGRAERLASVCTGAFLLAEAGCLAGARVTTHWWDAQKLADRFSDLCVDPDAIFIQSGRIWSSAGVTAGIDLALALVERDHGRKTALTIARHLVVPRMRPGGQSQYSAELEAQAVADQRLTRLVEAVRAEPQASWSVEEMADRLAVTRRTLTRLCRSKLDLSPAALVERLRLDQARQALVETDKPLEHIAEDSGFTSLQRMDRAFARRLGIAPREFRTRFTSPFSKESAS